MTTTIRRYERVKEILDSAADGSTAVYGGDIPFWHLPLDQLMEFTAYGVRMIAPSAVSGGASCCESKKETANFSPDRGKESGLIRGLKGQPPFDGKPFAKLPWGGKEVALNDILFIQDWIDDGCPIEEEVVSVLLEDATLQTGAATMEVSERIFVYQAADAYLDQPGNKRIRMNLDCMSESQVDTFRMALREMYDLNKFRDDWRSYNSIALIHQNHCQHAWERFLPWHRVYLYEFERALNDCLGHSFGIPYWDWTMPRYMDGDPKNGSVIPKSFKAFLTPESIVELNKTTDIPDAKLKDLEQLLGIRYTSQQAFFTAVKEVLKVEDISSWRNAFIDVLLASNALWYPLRYPAEFFDEGKPSTMENVIGYHYPSADDIRQIQGINNFRDYGGGSRYDNSYGFMDQNPHNTIHIWSGGQNPEWDKETKGILAKGRGYNRHSDLYTQPQYGDMFSNLTASFDPIFWPHHVNIDRLWSEWQRNNPNSNPSDPTAVLTPWNYTVVDTLDASKFGYEYLKSCYRFPVGMGETIPRFTSEPITVPEAALRQHHSVEIRLHQVPQLPLSCYVRAFINQPDANPQTPIHDNPHYAGYLAIFGHGECYGGPGHCDIPPPQAPLFDLREQRLHNNPRNHRIDATACIDKLIEQGASEFQITLVVVGVDGREMRDFLRLESVSLNFTD